jgi:hypothetical protein
MSGAGGKLVGFKPRVLKGLKEIMRERDPFQSINKGVDKESIIDKT